MHLVDGYQFGGGRGGAGGCAAVDAEEEGERHGRYEEGLGLFLCGDFWDAFELGVGGREERFDGGFAWGSYTSAARLVSGSGW